MQFIKNNEWATKLKIYGTYSKYSEKILSSLDFAHFNFNSHDPIFALSKKDLIFFDTIVFNVNLNNENIKIIIWICIDKNGNLTHFNTLQKDCVVVEFDSNLTTVYYNTIFSEDILSCLKLIIKISNIATTEQNYTYHLYNFENFNSMASNILLEIKNILKKFVLLDNDVKENKNLIMKDQESTCLIIKLDEKIYNLKEEINIIKKDCDEIIFQQKTTIENLRNENSKLNSKIERIKLEIDKD